MLIAYRRKELAPLWLPSELGEKLEFWGKPGDAVTTGTGVATFPDGSGNSRDFTQADDARRPTFSATAIDGLHPGITFNGSSDTLTRSPFIFDLGACSIHAVLVSSTTALGKCFIGEANSGQAQPLYFPLRSGNTATRSGYAYRADANASSLFNSDTGMNFRDGLANVIGFLDTGASLQHYKNGLSATEAPYTRETTTFDTASLGAEFNNSTSPQNFLSVTVGEVVIAGGALSVDNRQRIEGYLAHGVGRQTSLPAAHPYRTTPPRI